MTEATNKLKLWKSSPSLSTAGGSLAEAELAWEMDAKAAAAIQPLKSLKQMPNMIGITPETAKGLKWKSLKWMVAQDHDRKILKNFLKHPFRYGWRWLKSILKAKSFKREGDFFLYGVDSLDQFSSLLKDPEALFVIGFSYCHKPFECPSGRFTDQCIHDRANPVCRQCFIGKTINALPDKNNIPLIIPTIHYVGGRIFELVHQHPGKRILFIITACELALDMFGDWGNMVDIMGLGVRLDGRICNTMKAFELSEQGIKPGLTVVLPPTQQRISAMLWERGHAS